MDKKLDAYTINAFNTIITTAERNAERNINVIFFYFNDGRL